MHPRVLFKLILKRFKCIPSFCKVCGCDVEDFIVDDTLWNEVEKEIKYGNVLCYNCFCKLLKNKGMYAVFRLIQDDN